ncbi:MAG: MFS transporter [Frankiaceae bacterium]|nr:MFS transporter [Frankiaceae bacterium]
MTTLVKGRASAAETPPATPGPTSLVPLLAVGAGVAVADNYYLQPLLALVGVDLGVGVGTLGLVSALALLGYALGLLLVVPLGDLVDRRPLVTGILGLTTVSLAAMTLAPSVGVLAVAAFAVGLTSVVAQVLVPYAVSLADDASRGRVAGTMMSGVLGGILAARVVAGLGGGALGWRAVYAGATGLTAALLVVLLRRLPAETERHRRNGRADVPYREVLKGVARLARGEPGLRVRAVYGFCGFAVFSAIWTTLAFHLRDAFGLGAPAVAGVALLGLAGILVAPRAGALADRGRSVLVTGGAYALLLVGTGVLALGADSLPLLLLGIVLCDVALNSGHVTSLGVIYRLVPHARSRATTVYMTAVFLGGATGSVVAASAYAAAGWSGTAAVCAALAAVALLRWLLRLAGRAPRARDEPFPEAVA